MNDSFGGGFTQQPGDAKTENKSEGTLPVFIKMIHNQKDDTLKMYGFEYKMVSTVALVRSIEHSTTKITYTLEDLSGQINAHLWVEEGEAPSSSNIMLNTYARVIGAVRQQGDTKSIMVYKIQPVKGINEVNTHYIEVVNARYQSEEYFKSGDLIADGGASKMDIDTAKAEGIEGIKGKDLIVFTAIQSGSETHAETGFSRTEMCRKFPHFSEHEMNNIIDKLTVEGHIYSTIDSDHFLACF